MRVSACEVGDSWQKKTQKPNRGVQVHLAAILSGNLLQTLPARRVKNGVAEVIKIAIACDSALFELLEENMEELGGKRVQYSHGRGSGCGARSTAMLSARHNPVPY